MVFWDNLQWADLTSLLLLKELATKYNIQFLHSIGAFRSTEVSESHPLMIELKEIQKSGFTNDHISLSFLEIDQVNNLIAETLKIEKTKSQPLAEIIVKKTNGNPFFVNRFLKKLHENGTLEFDKVKGWKWDIDRINQIKISDNVVANHFMFADALKVILGAIHLEWNQLTKANQLLKNALDSLKPTTENGIIINTDFHGVNAP